jgi:AraC family transcriptional regulator
MDVHIVNFLETKVAALEHSGSPEQTYESIRKLVARRLEIKLPIERHRSFGVHYNDPRTTPPPDYRIDLCLSVEHGILPNSYSLVNKNIPSVRCAGARHQGSCEFIPIAIYLYEVWLPASNERLREPPVFFIMSMLACKFTRTT